MRCFPEVIYSFEVFPTHGCEMSIVLSSELAFRNARGVSWVRRGNGILEKNVTDFLELYGISLPCSRDGCERILPIATLI